MSASSGLDGRDGPAAALRRYRLGPRDRRGVLGGIGRAQAIVLLSGLIAATACLHLVAGSPGVLGAASAAAAGIAAAVVAPRGRSVADWVPDLVAYAARRFCQQASRPRRLRARAGRTSAARGLGARRPARLGSAARLPAGRGPAGLELVEIRLSSGEALAAVRDRRAGRLTAVLALAGEGFAMLGGAERARVVASWSRLLVSVGGERSCLDRLAWIARTVPDTGASLRRPLGVAAPGVSASYEQLLTSQRAELCHEVWLACSKQGPASGLAAALEAVRASCHAAGLAVTVPLAGPDLCRLISGAAASGERDSSSWPWPTGIKEGWSCLRTDGTWQASFWVAEWPRTAVTDDFLLPLLLGSFTRRAVCLVLAPQPPARATRRAEQASTAGAAEAELRARHGFSATARRAEEQEAIARREQELALGHRSYRFNGYVTVTADSRERLEQDCSHVEHTAALAGMDLRRLYGCQLEGFTCTLPAGRGCR